MKIAFIVSLFPKLSETFILNQVTGLLDLGHDVEIFANNPSNEGKAHQDIKKYQLMERVHYFNIPESKVKRIFKAIYLILVNFCKYPVKILKSLNIFRYGKEALSLRLLYIAVPFLGKDFNIVHCHFGPNGIIGVLLKEIGISGKIITSFHGYDVNSYPKLKGKNVYSNLFRKGGLFTVNTNFTKQRVVDLGCDKDKIIVLPMGVRIDKFKVSEGKIGLGDTIKILTVGRLVEKKGYEYSIKSIANVITKHEDILYMIVGDGPLKNRLKSLVSELGVGKYIKFLGALEEGKILSLYQNASIFVLASVTARNEDREGQALVLQEAQASGLPVISTLHNGIPEGVIDGKSGFLVPERDIDALAEKLEYLIEHPEIWPDMGRAGRKFVEERYDINKLNKRVVEIYRALHTNNVNELERLKRYQ